MSKKLLFACIIALCVVFKSYTCANTIIKMKSYAISETTSINLICEQEDSYDDIIDLNSTSRQVYS